MTNLYIVTYMTNYDLACMIIEATHLAEARNIAEINGAWIGYDIEEIIKKGESNLIFKYQ